MTKRPPANPLDVWCDNIENLKGNPKDFMSLSEVSDFLVSNSNSVLVTLQNRLNGQAYTPDMPLSERTYIERMFPKMPNGHDMSRFSLDHTRDVNQQIDDIWERAKKARSLAAFKNVKVEYNLLMMGHDKRDILHEYEVKDHAHEVEVLKLRAARPNGQINGPSGNGQITYNNKTDGSKDKDKEPPAK